MHFSIRRAIAADFPFVVRLEERVFEPNRRESRRSLLRSLRSPHQEVWIAVDERGAPVGVLVLRVFLHTIRIYSIGVDPIRQGEGIGSRLLEWGVERACARRSDRISLEVDARDQRLVRFYAGKRFSPVCTLPDYYGPGAHGLRMVRRIAVCECGDARSPVTVGAGDDEN